MMPSYLHCVPKIKPPNLWLITDSILFE